MLRLNFSHSEQCLKITTLKTVHHYHLISADNFARVSAKVRKLSSPNHSHQSSGKFLLFITFN